MGFDRGTDYLDLIELDVEQEMYNTNSGLYLRVPFEVDNPCAFLSLALEVQFDDAFVAYLNGTRVANRNTSTNPAWNASASLENPDADALEFDSFSLASHLGTLRKGTNVLATQHDEAKQKKLAQEWLEFRKHYLQVR